MDAIRSVEISMHTGIQASPRRWVGNERKNRVESMEVQRGESTMRHREEWGFHEKAVGYRETSG